MTDPSILWPAPVDPVCLASGETAFDVIADARGTDDLAGWAGRLGLREAAGLSPRPLEVERIEPIEDPHSDDRVRDAVASIDPPPELVRFRCVASPEPSHSGARRVTVDDLVVGDQVARSRAVARRHAHDGRLSIALASDLHVSSIWDLVSDGIDRHAPDLKEQFHSPNRFLERFIHEVNDAARRGEIDAVVLTGDLIDHILPHRSPEADTDNLDAETDNLDRLLEILSVLEVPAFAVPGNHDHRVNPWRPRLAGLEFVGIPNDRAGEILQDTDLWDRWPVHYRDPDAFRTHDAEGRDGIRQYLTRLSPALDRTRDLDDLRLVLLSTGRDIHLRPGEVEPSRLPLLLRSFAGCWNHPDSEGLFPEQIERIVTASEGARGLALFFHAPLLNPPPGLDVDLQLDPGPADGLTAEIRFEWNLWSSGLRRGVFFRNPGALLRVLAAIELPISTFSGHTHHSHALSFDPKTYHFRSFPFGKAPTEPIGFYIAPALGPSARLEPETPGYLRLSFQRGAVRSVERVPMSG